MLNQLFIFIVLKQQLLHQSTIHRGSTQLSVSTSDDIELQMWLGNPALSVNIAFRTVCY